MKKGMSLIELIIYIAIVSIIGTASVQFVTRLILGRVKSNLEENVIHNLRYSSRIITHAIRAATTINNITSSTLCIDSPVVLQNPTRFYLSSNTLYVGYGGDCNTSTQNYALTSNDVSISNLLFRQSVAGAATTIDFSYNISGIAGNARQEWNYATTASSSATLR